MGKKTTRKRWTQEECNILRRIVTENTWSIGDKLASITLNRSIQSCIDKATRLKLSGNRRILKGDSADVKKVLKKHISENPNNLQEAFRKTAAECNVSVATIHNRWYGTVGYKEAWKNTIGTCFMTVGKNYTVNSKNTNENKKTGIWTKIKKLFKLK